MREYRVSFFKLEWEVNPESKKKEKVKEEYMGSITVDDHGCGPYLTIAGKAWRLAPSRYLSADKTIVEQV